MFLLEIYSGKLKRAVLPLEQDIFFTGDGTSLDPQKHFYVPEYLGFSSSVRVFLEDERPFFEQSSSAKTAKVRKRKIRRNLVYRVDDLLFFVYMAGERRPRDLMLKLKQYFPIISFFFLASMAGATVLVGYGLKANEQAVRDFVHGLPFAHIKDGYIYVDSQYNLASSALPWGVSKHIVRVDKGPAIKVPSLFVEVQQAGTSKPVATSVQERNNHAILVVKTYDKLFAIARILNRKKIAFSTSGGVFFVSDIDKVKKLLAAHSIEFDPSLFKEKQQSLNLIDSDEFFYDVHISSGSVPFLLKGRTRYWKGSSVPEYGKITEFDEEKIVFVDEEGERSVYIVRGKQGKFAAPR